MDIIVLKNMESVEMYSVKILADKYLKIKVVQHAVSDNKKMEMITHMNIGVERKMFVMMLLLLNN